MDSLITAAARALAKGDPLEALNWVALRDDAPALALRGIAMARLGDFDKANNLLAKAARAFGAKQPMARARCIVAEAEIALVSRDLGWPAKALKDARDVLEQHNDRANADYARHLEIRHALLVGQLDEAEQALKQVDASLFAPALKAAHELLVAGIAIRRLQTKKAKTALENAAYAARLADIPALLAEIENAEQILKKPAARLLTRNGEQTLLLEDVEALFASKALIVDGCRYVVRKGSQIVSLAKRPVLFALASALAEAWPEDVTRDELIARAFKIKQPDDTLRARLRVEIGRLRAALQYLTEVHATEGGFIFAPHDTKDIVALAQPGEEKNAAVLALLALLADGEAWSSSALALVLEMSQRSVQRALDALEEEGKVQSLGRGRTRRWISFPLPGFTTTLLLPGPLPSD